MRGVRKGGFTGSGPLGSRNSENASTNEREGSMHTQSRASAAKAYSRNPSPFKAGTSSDPRYKCLRLYRYNHVNYLKTFLQKTAVHGVVFNARVA